MAEPDDGGLDRQQYARIRRAAGRLLRKADAVGAFPTPVDEIAEAAGIEVAAENILSEEFISSARRGAGEALRRAASKVIGLFDARGRRVFIDRDVLPVRQTFLKLHETGHAVLPWQRDIYAVIEDGEKELDPDTAELFDREASVFAAEVLFQLDGFTNEAKDLPFGMSAPIDLSQRYGASIYASVRQYVSKHPRECAVIVLNAPEFEEGDGFRAAVRRVVSSPSFRKRFGELDLPRHFTPDDEFGAMVPVGTARSSEPRGIVLLDRNGARCECVAESFTNTYQVFILIHASRALAKSTVVIPAEPA